ncbi:MAG TPA: 16S rRNA (cytosine(967)-C(5))-methyltransferase RsmB [Pyrinomonadaceae bacterium]
MAKANEVSAARVAAFEVLKQVEGGAFSSVALAAKEPELQPLDRALCHELVMGVLRWQLSLDKIIEHYSGRSVDSLDPPVLHILRLGLYQLRFLSRIPPSAAVNESVNLVARARLRSARPFVNAVLRRAVREPEYSPGATASSPLERLVVETSHPLWLIERWISAFGFEQAEVFTRANNETPPVAIRVVTSAHEESDVLDKLRSAGATIEPSGIAKHAWRISGATGEVRKLVQAGEIYVQDEASQLVAEVLNVEAAERVLDLCAAPGGKSTAIANRAVSASVLAMDVSQRRLETVAQNVKSHRLKNVSLMVADAAKPLPFRSETFDRVLVDAPCSGTGTLRHNPEIRWRLTAGDIEELSQQQTRFLLNASTAVKPGGSLVYSTCSVEPEENEGVVREFLSGQKVFRQVIAPVNPELLTDSGAARTWPQRDGVDGFYIAVFRKT